MAEADVRLARFAARILLAFVSAVTLVAAQGQTPDCRESQACRELALEARTRGAYETFHDLAWRAVQTGRPNDPDLMYLLARAQALSGRRRDALIMLRRLAEAGMATIVTDAATEEDFRRVREMPEWQGVMALADRPRSAAAPVDSSVAATKPSTPGAPPPVSAAPAPIPAAPAPPSATPPRRSAAAASAPAVRPAPPAPAPAPPAAARSSLRVEPAVVEEAARFSTGPFALGGLAYDAVSRRFLFGDRDGRRLFVVGEGSDRTVDLARADSAGFDEVTAIAIDPKRGHLWVATTSADGSGAALHHLQLISGRALRKLPAPGQDSMRLTDMAVVADGTVFILDSAAPRLLVLRPGATALQPLMPLKTPDPVSISVDDEGRLAYVAHREGIARLDLQARRAATLNAAKGIDLAGFEYVRAHRNVLVGSQVQPDGSRGLVRLQLNGDRSTATRATLIDAPPSREDGPTAATVSGDNFYYLVAPRTETQDSASGSVNMRVRRIKLP